MDMDSFMMLCRSVGMAFPKRGPSERLTKAALRLAPRASRLSGQGPYHMQSHHLKLTFAAPPPGKVFLVSFTIVSV